MFSGGMISGGGGGSSGGSTSIGSTIGGSPTEGGLLFTDSSGALTQSIDADPGAVPGTVGIVGRMRIGSTASDNAALAHYDNMSTTNYALRQLADGSTYLNASSTASDALNFAVNGTQRWKITNGGHLLPGTGNTYDIGTTTSGPRRVHLHEYIETIEMTAPAAPAANHVRIFCQDNGAGKTQLMAIFPTGAAQQLAIEP